MRTSKKQRHECKYLPLMFGTHNFVDGMFVHTLQAGVNTEHTKGEDSNLPPRGTSSRIGATVVFPRKP